MTARQWIRGWAWVLAPVAIVVAFGLLLVPRSVVYFRDGHAPYHIEVVYTSDRGDYVISTDRGEPCGDGEVVRLGCGNSLTTGDGETQRAYIAEDGPTACSRMEKPRRIVGLVLAALGAVGLFAAIRLLRWRDPEPT